jgi:predicted dehydrogenase
MGSDQLRVGIIGCGLIGNKRARVIHDDPDAYLCCAADVVMEKGDSPLFSFKKEEQSPFYTDWKEMLEKETLDVVIAATPNKYLKDIVETAAKKKIHILCEKPLGRNVREAEGMVKAARENNVILKTGFNHRFHPAIRTVYQLVTDAVIGEIYFTRCIYGHGGRPGYEKEWRASKDICGGGEILDQGVHVVDLFRWILGEFDEVFGYISTFYWKMEVEDNAFALFKTVNGQIAQMHTSWTQWKNRFTLEIYGKAGYLIVDGLGGSYGVEKLTIGKRPCKNGDSPYFSAEKMGQSPFFYLGGVPEEEIIIFEGPDTSCELEWKEFTAAIREKREPSGSGRDGLEANRIIEAVYRSSRENRPVKIR